MSGFKVSMLMSLVVAHALATSSLALAQDKVELGICGGGKSGTYIKAAKYIKQMLVGNSGKSDFEVKVYETEGSQDNINLMAEEKCQVAVIQNDTNEWYLRQAHATPLALRTVNKAYKEHFHMVCHRSLKVEDFDDLVKLSKTGQSLVYVGSANSGGAMTMDNLKNLRKDYESINPFPNDRTEKLDHTQNAIDLALLNKACAAFVTRAPYEHLKKLNETQYRELNLVNMNDGKFNNLEDKDGNELYEFVKYSDLEENLYNKLRMRNPDATGLSSYGERDIYALAITANVVVNVDWETNMKGQLQTVGKTGTVMKWDRVLGNIAKFNGNFDQIASVLKAVTSQPPPRD
ncbi:MAG: TAXI family TRAP transporter solute-binding subunit [Bdellovibrionales bacterium]